MVQVTPFRGSRLADMVTQAEQINQGRSRISQNERSLDLQAERVAQQGVQLQQSSDQQKQQGVLFAFAAGGSKEGAIALLQQLPGLPADVIPAVQAIPDEAVPGLVAAGQQLTQSGQPSAIQERDRLLEDLKSQDKDVRRSARISLGLDARAVGNAATTIAGGDGPSPEDVADVESTLAAGSAAGKKQIEIATDSLTELGKVRKNIANIQEARRLVEEGAGVGAIQSRLPSIQAASIALDNIQGRLGLDIVGATTFGALSEAELAFALNTALPSDLDGPALIDWLNRKEAAQQKLSEELQGAATFLSQPQNSLADYMQFLESSGALSFQERPVEPTQAELEAEARRRGLIQ